MEWEVMVMCNSLGVILLFLIAAMQIVGVDAENNAKIIDFNKEWSRSDSGVLSKTYFIV